MIKSLIFKEDYEFVVEREEQKRFPTRHVIPKKYDREKEPYDFFKLFTKGLRIDFKPDINVIVGENGSGKTTLISLLKRYSGKPYKAIYPIVNDFKDEDDYLMRYQDDYDGELEVDGELKYNNTIYYDGEKDNPVIVIPKMLNPESKDFLSLSAQLFFAQEESHGESMLPALKYILRGAKNCVIFMDEPETALSLKNQFWLVDVMKESVEKNHNQIIISTHALGIINCFSDIYDMEARNWVGRKSYINDIQNI